ncbi:HTH-type transcriptional repressor ComR [Pelagimonas phthalicica]|uniref:HTH-type transcriptional repressor ComR n=1 Tax=Pelagimonas phthalicica TaxID=1037362 RepID=A0A238JK79_9RHOB|nr:TetR/AcrR family transcriptional regulator [Pelagimonas phthalicica]TDS90019.1 TetR family transcriptional regulator [Pelagimonas phthalicica]SMX30186.1 HTH-type transcriptional repressor ComR [Pelagimonas phthalicica]
MPRPIEYDKNALLDRALKAFWINGYAGCSIQELVEATGMGRQGLYNVFGDKDGVFLAAAEHYTSMVAEQCKPLHAPDANMATIKSFILSSLAAQETHGGGACFAVVTAFSPQATDPRIAPVLEAVAHKVRSGFAGVLRAEQDRGRVTSHASTEALADYLYASMNGLSALAKTGGGRVRVEDALDIALATLDHEQDTTCLAKPS